MCGRFFLATPSAALIQRFGLTSCVDYGPRYNIAPMTNIVVIRQNAARHFAGRGRSGLARPCPYRSGHAARLYSPGRFCEHGCLPRTPRHQFLS